MEAGGGGGFFPAKSYFYLIDKEIKKQEEERYGGDEYDASCEGLKELTISDGKGFDSAIITPSKMSQYLISSITQKRKQEGFDFSNVNPEFAKEIKAYVANMGPVVIEMELQETRNILVSEIVELPYIIFTNRKKAINSAIAIL